jgi:hypothetical protein
MEIRDKDGNLISGNTKSLLQRLLGIDVKGYSDNSLAGRFIVEHRDKSGTLLSTISNHNDITNEGLEYLLNLMFFDDSAFRQITNWYIGLINNSGYTGVANTDTLASHTGWTAFSTWDESAKPEWAPETSYQITEGGLVKYNITNLTAKTFTMGGAAVLKGIYISSNSAKTSDTTGVLWSTGLFDSTIALNENDTLSIYYAVVAGRDA